MVTKSPNIILFSFNKKNVTLFLKYLTKKFEVLEKYVSENYVKVKYKKSDELGTENKYEEEKELEKEKEKEDVKDEKKEQEEKKGNEEKKEKEEKEEKDEKKEKEEKDEKKEKEEKEEKKEKEEKEEKDEKKEKEEKDEKKEKGEKDEKKEKEEKDEKKEKEEKDEKKEKEEKDEKKKNEEFVFFLKKEMKIKLSNKYYTATVEICSCIAKKNKKENIEENQKNETSENGESREEKELQEENNIVYAEDLLCECIIFLFDDFSKNEKEIVNLNPFRKYGYDTLEYIKNPEDGKIIKNQEFDLTNYYKDVAIRLAIFPSTTQQKDNQILRFFSEYFIEVLYIDYTPEKLEEKEKCVDGTENKNVKPSKKFDEYYEDAGERFVEAIHCHMWTGLIIKKKNYVNENAVYAKGDAHKKELASDEGNKCNKLKGEEENGKDIQKKKKKDQKEDMVIEKSNDNDVDKNNLNDIKDDDDLFIKNFNRLVEKIKLAKIENKNCSDHIRRKNAEEIITELQQYMCDCDEE